MSSSNSCLPGKRWEDFLHWRFTALPFIYLTWLGNWDSGNWERVGGRVHGLMGSNGNGASADFLFSSFRSKYLHLLSASFRDKARYLMCMLDSSESFHGLLLWLPGWFFLVTGWLAGLG